MERVCAYVPGKHMYALSSTFSDYVQSQDIVVAVCNYKNDHASIGRFNILDVTHKGEVVNPNVSEMQGSTATVCAQYMPFKLVEAAQVCTGREGCW